MLAKVKYSCLVLSCLVLSCLVVSCDSKKGNKKTNEEGSKATQTPTGDEVSVSLKTDSGSIKISGSNIAVAASVVDTKGSGVGDIQVIFTINCLPHSDTTTLDPVDTDANGVATASLPIKNGTGLSADTLKFCAVSAAVDGANPVEIVKAAKIMGTVYTMAKSWADYDWSKCSDKTQNQRVRVLIIDSDGIPQNPAAESDVNPTRWKDSKKMLILPRYLYIPYLGTIKPCVVGGETIYPNPWILEEVESTADLDCDSNTCWNYEKANAMPFPDKDSVPNPHAIYWLKKKSDERYVLIKAKNK